MRMKGMKYAQDDRLLLHMDRILENVLICYSRNNEVQGLDNVKALCRYAREFQRRFPDATRQDIELINKLSR